MEVKVRYPGSFGELIQGIYEGKEVLVSCPVNLYTEITISNNIYLKEHNLFKTQKFLNNVLKSWKLDKELQSLNIGINSNISKGKGFSSSTADLCGVYKGLTKYFQREFNIQELIENCIKIEPTDSILFPKLTIFDYKKGTYYEEIGNYPKFYILAFEGEKVVDTISFNRSVKEPLFDINSIMKTFIEAVKKEDLKTIGMCCTESIERNLKRLPYDIFPYIKKINKDKEGLGIIGAHSGDALGIIYEDKEKAFWTCKHLLEIKGYKTYILETLTEV